MLQVERGGVLHQPYAHPVGEEIAQERFEEAAAARGDLAGDDNAELDGDQRR
ncbi:hypothetical protein D3C83_314600 [compost metagenome]